MNRTGSIGSRVPPAVTTTRRPAKSYRERTASAIASKIVCELASRPVPTCPLARCPDSGSTMVTPRRRSVVTFSCTASFAHIASFIAGAITTGHRAASKVAVTMSSERPAAIRPTTLAVAGATRISCAQSPRNTCGSGEVPPPHSPVWTRLPVTPSNVGGPTKRVAEDVIATRTSLPAWTKADARSTTLYVDLEHDVAAACQRTLDTITEGAVKIAVVGGVLEECALRDEVFELPTGEEGVVLVWLLARSGLPRRPRHGIDKIAIQLEQPPDQGVLAHARRSGDHDQLAALHGMEDQKAAKSTGGGASNVISRPVRGWRRCRRQA